MPHELAVAVAGVRLGERHATPEAQNTAADLDLAAIRPQRAQEADLDLD
jgi:hypothetical protein